MTLKMMTLRKKRVALGCSLVFCVVAFCAPASGRLLYAGMRKTAAPVFVKKTFYGEASFYSDKFNGRQTSNGEIFSQSKMTCACNGLPLGTWIKVTNLRNNKWAIVKVNDRLHPSMKRVVDLTRAAAKKLAFINAGITRVRVEVLGKKKPTL